MDGLLYGGTQLLLASLLMLAGLGKLSQPRSFVDTVLQLGVPPVLAAAAAGIVIGAEIGAGIALALAPSWTLPRIGAVGLGVVFAAAALWARRSGRSVECHCFGVGGQALLGRRQILALPAWVGLALIAGVRPPSWGATSGCLALAWLLLLATLIRAQRMRPRWRDLRADRAAFD